MPQAYQPRTVMLYERICVNRSYVVRMLSLESHADIHNTLDFRQNRTCVTINSTISKQTFLLPTFLASNLFLKINISLIYYEPVNFTTAVVITITYKRDLPKWIVLRNLFCWERREENEKSTVQYNNVYLDLHKKQRYSIDVTK